MPSQEDPRAWPFVADALAVCYWARDDEAPPTAKATMMAGRAYFVLPVDAIPDFIAFLGYSDDAAVFAAPLGVVG